MGLQKFQAFLYGNGFIQSINNNHLKPASKYHDPYSHMPDRSISIIAIA